MYFLNSKKRTFIWMWHACVWFFSLMLLLDIKTQIWYLNFSSFNCQHFQPTENVVYTFHHILLKCTLPSCSDCCFSLTFRIFSKIWLWLDVSRKHVRKAVHLLFFIINLSNFPPLKCFPGALNTYSLISFWDNKFLWFNSSCKDSKLRFSDIKANDLCTLFSSRQSEK